MSTVRGTFAAPSSRIAQFYALTKPRVVQLIVFCALIGMLLAQPGLPDLRLAVPAVIGIWLVAGAAAFAFPSTKEGFGLAAMEALAAGVPLVTRDLPVLREVFGRAARFASDPAGLADALAAAIRPHPVTVRVLTSTAAITFDHFAPKADDAAAQEAFWVPLDRLIADVAAR